MNKKQRTAKAARAAKRIPLVGTTVVLLPIVEAFADAGVSSSNLSSMATWRSVGENIRTNYLGIDNFGSIKVDRLLRTWLPIGGYLLAGKFHLSRPISKVLGKIGLRF